ncbi:MAG: hypothetical protein U0230_01500 [Polyangiales bacterium]
MTIALRLEPADDAALTREYEGNLRHGRALVPEVADADPLTPATLVVVRPSDGAELHIPGQIVMILPDGAVRGTALELDFTREVSREHLEGFVAGMSMEPEPSLETMPGESPHEAFGGLVPLEEVVEPEATGAVEEPALETPHEAFGGLVPLEPIDEPSAAPSTLPPTLDSLEPPTLDSLEPPPAASAASAEAVALPAMPEPEGVEAAEATESVTASSEGEAEGEAEEEGGSEAGPVDNKLLRIRKLSAAERTRCAREGTLEDRVLLERCFGKTVWEDLLRNPQLTTPEVARIASKGSAPRPLLEQIVDNAGWARQSIVRRALLTNPRVSADGIAKLLRLTPKNELRLICQTSAYPATVRAAAKKMLTD